eukprot:TRINITY_DN7203_c0_g1_i3.p1 TRINITY_DN7203_c0_g1~~TRINITY_DN7203_c0_g1_i3.p1  ORF type:complete len:234 (-),score=-25.98 TRINITY_DN7203_c0_g1_i3:194-895(-)
MVFFSFPFFLQALEEFPYLNSRKAPEVRFLFSKMLSIDFKGWKLTQVVLCLFRLETQIRFFQFMFQDIFLIFQFSYKKCSVQRKNYFDIYEIKEVVFCVPIFCYCTDKKVRGHQYQDKIHNREYKTSEKYLSPKHHQNLHTNKISHHVKHINLIIFQVKICKKCCSQKFTRQQMKMYFQQKKRDTIQIVSINLGKFQNTYKQLYRQITNYLYRILHYYTDPLEMKQNFISQLI